MERAIVKWLDKPDEDGNIAYIDIPIHFISPTKVGILTHLEFIPQGWLDLKRLLNMGPNEE
jgi:hypothetical protein